MKNLFFYGVIVFILAIVSWVGIEFYKANQPKSVVLQGEIEAQSYSVSSKVPGRIAEVYVKKGDNVKVGDAIFSIYSPEVEAKLQQALAAKEAASAKKAQADNGAREEQIKAAEEQYKKAKAAVELLEKTYNRIKKLYESGVVSQQKKDEIYTKYQAAIHTKNAAYEMMQMAKKGARKEIKEAAKAQEKVYEGKVSEVESFIKELKQYAFVNAEVSGVLIHQGELAPSGFPVVTLLDMKDVWARLNVREDFLHYFPMGKKIKLSIPALGKSYEFKVSYIAPQGEYAVWKATESGKGFDMKSFEVELRPLKEIPNLRVGMSVLVEVK